ncbi:MAG: DUF1833 family protein [Candidatus Scalindua sp.]|jgi:hypothetical protein|nr:DUF1833 family protein [Candidatus Scalindua sp.]
MAVTTTTKQQAFLPETSEVYLVLLTISQADVTTLRVVNNNEDVTSNGNVFTGFPFEIQLPDQREDSPPNAQLTIDNTSREIAQAIRNMTSPATILIEVIRAADPDTIEKTYAVFTLRNVEWDATRVTGDLILEDVEREPFPAGQFSPAEFPGLF